VLSRNVSESNLTVDYWRCFPTLFQQLNWPPLYKWIIVESDIKHPCMRNDVKDGVIVVYRQLINFSAISWREQVNFQWDDDEVIFVLDQHVLLDFYSASSLHEITIRG
jgi:hypothetical protein